MTSFLRLSGADINLAQVTHIERDREPWTVHFANGRLYSVEPGTDRAHILIAFADPRILRLPEPSVSLLAAVAAIVNDNQNKPRGEPLALTLEQFNRLHAAYRRVQHAQRTAATPATAAPEVDPD